MSHVHEPLTLPKYPQLLSELNEMSMRIKVNLIGKENLSKKQLDDLITNHPPPTWKEIEDLLTRAYHAINEQRYNPIKY